MDWRDEASSETTCCEPMSRRERGGAAVLASKFRGVHVDGDSAMALSDHLSITQLQSIGQKRY